MMEWFWAELNKPRDWTGLKDLVVDSGVVGLPLAVVLALLSLHLIREPQNRSLQDLLGDGLHVFKNTRPGPVFTLQINLTLGCDGCWLDDGREFVTITMPKNERELRQLAEVLGVDISQLDEGQQT